MRSKVQKSIVSDWKFYKRHYPWRIKPGAYKIMIAEFMLQRTKADQVDPVYKKFLRQYPTIKHLSKAKAKSVLKYTSSLGLHGRYKKFIDAGKFVITKLDGKFPKSQVELKKIPGVGDYVAGAISAVCFNTADYVIDSNIARFINRYNNLRLDGEIRRKKIILAKAKKLFTFKDQKNLLFAILDFTALVCKPTKPICFECTVKRSCKFQDKTRKQKQAVTTLSNVQK